MSFSRHTITPRLLQMEREARSLTGCLLSEQPSHAMNFDRRVTTLCRNFTPLAFEANATPFRSSLLQNVDC